MIANRSLLLELCPIKDMLNHKESFGGVSHGLTEAGYDIRIKQSIRFLPGEGVEVLDNKSYYHYEGNFVLASSLERFNMPPNLVGVVHDKSTWARRGLSVFNTVIEPGWKGWLTLELVYHGGDELVIPPGVGIAQVLFHRTEHDAIYDGKYNNQGDYPVPAKDSE